MTEQKNTANPTGLTTAEAEERQKQFGRNELIPKKKKNLFREILKALSEPMFLLLIVTAVIYFLLGEPRDGAVMLIFVLGMISIDVVQGWKTDKTLNALKDLAAPRITVLRDGAERRIDSAIITEPKLLLADEPTGALDSHSADGLLRTFDQLNADGQTVVMVTHSVKAACHAQRVLFIQDGEVFHQLYRGKHTEEELFALISDTLTLLATGGEKDA